MPTGRGKKGSQATRQRKRSVTPTIRTDGIADITQSASGDGSTISQSLTGNSGSTVNFSLDSVPPSTNYSPLGYATPYSAYPSFPWMSGSSAYHDWPGPSAYHGWYSPNIPMPHQPVPPMATPPQPVPPMAEECSLFKLCFIFGNISKCAGCGNNYSKPLVSPYNLCIQHREWRSFTPSGGTQQSRFSPSYYHVNLLCVKRNWPLFKPQDFVITPQIFQKLRQQHLDFLSSFGYYHD